MEIFKSTVNCDILFSVLVASLCVLIVGRDIGIVSAVVYLRLKTVPRPVSSMENCIISNRIILSLSIPPNAYSKVSVKPSLLPAYYTTVMMLAQPAP